MVATQQDESMSKNCLVGHLVVE